MKSMTMVGHYMWTITSTVIFSRKDLQDAQHDLSATANLTYRKTDVWQYTTSDRFATATILFFIHN